MIKNEILARRYADAFLVECSNSITFERGIQELQRAKRLFVDCPEFKEFAQSLQITNREKFEFIDRTMKNFFPDELKNFLKLLLDKGRINIFTDIADYARVTYSHGEEMDALMKISYPLEIEMIEALKIALENRFNRKLHLYVELDPDLLGGIYVKVGNTIIDGSIRKRVEDLREKLMALNVEHYGN
ncbi:MAG: ATP synthase F1 subunit delta [Candidatus Omnitrophota bacterium]|jgi:F-type H+-transporting ATPase subunit delta